MAMYPSKTSNDEINCFIQHLDTPHANLAFAAMDLSKLLPALQWAIGVANARITAICVNPEPVSFANTILQLEHSGVEVEAISTIFFNWLHADTNETLQQQVQPITAALADYQNAVLLNEDLFQRIHTLYRQRENLDLNAVELRLLEQNYLDFTSNGALLDTAAKKTLKEINKELSSLGPKFSKNVLDDTNAFHYHIEKDEDTAGIPEHVLNHAAALAQQKGVRGWILTLHAPCYIPVMQYAHSSRVREHMFRSRAKLAMHHEYNNAPIVAKTVSLRQQRAQLLGFDNHASCVLKRRMAANTDTVTAFLDDLERRYRPAATREFAELQCFAQQAGLEKLSAWDIAYFSDQLKRKTLDLDDEALRAYFRHDRVLEGVFALANKLYGLKFDLDPSIQSYHDDVLCYRVYENSSSAVATLYIDLYPRAGKNPGAWMTTWKTQSMTAGERHAPEVAIVMNTTPRNDDGYAFFSYDEVETLFHEFGHALHACLSNVAYASLASPNVYWDFVELPSQFMENYLAEKAVLDLFAHHDTTGEPLDVSLVAKIQQRQRFQAGLRGLRQVSLARLDMAWHQLLDTAELDVATFEETILSQYRLVEKVDGAGMSCQFSHIFAGGYAAGYYSYKWAEVLDADAFAYFKEKGLFDSNLAKQFRQNILEPGNSAPPQKLYEQFRHRAADPEALFARDGL